MSIKVSVVCITEDRPWAYPFFWWNYVKQTLPPEERELIIVDTTDWTQVPPGGGRIPQELGPACNHRTDFSLPHGATIGQKYNRGVELARGEVVTFFDDDDYHGPRHLEQMWQAYLMKGRPDILRCRDTSMMWLNIVDMKARYHKANIWAYYFYTMELAKQIKFNETSRIGADTVWVGDMNTASSRRGGRNEVVDLPNVCILLSHTKNIVNTAASAHRIAWKYDITKPPEMDRGEWDTLMIHVQRIRAELGIKDGQ